MRVHNPSYLVGSENSHLVTSFKKKVYFCRPAQFRLRPFMHFDGDVTRVCKNTPHLSIAQNWAKTKHHLKNFSKIKVPSILYRTKNGSKRISFFEIFSFSEECTIWLLVFWILWRFRICRLRYLSLYSRRKHVFYALLWKKFIFCKLAQMEKVKVIHFAQ